MIYHKLLEGIPVFCPLGGSPSGRNAQSSFAFHVQTPLFPGVWVSASLLLCSLPTSTLPPLTGLSDGRQCVELAKASLRTLDLKSVVLPPIPGVFTIPPLLSVPLMSLSPEHPSSSSQICLQPKTRVRKTLPWPLCVWWRKTGRFYRTGCMTLLSSRSETDKLKVQYQSKKTNK